ncbi:MAG: radical SAM family heme chaperone HemW [Bacillota bacterium]
MKNKVMHRKKLNFLREIKGDFALYIHLPFCKKKCSYCDFFSLSYNKKLVNEYLKVLKKEIKFYGNKLKEKVKTIYFGGGTPSLISTKSLAELLNLIDNNFSLANNIEISIEANPESLNENKIKAYKNQHINRISLGVQSFNEQELKLLGRLHDSKRAKKVIYAIKKHFDNFSFDLIFAIPGQSFSKWKNNLNTAIKIDPPHISIYNLQIEEETLLYKRLKNNELKTIKEELDAKMYEYTIKELKKYSFKQYEISNFAKKGYESKHNLCYWKYEPYLGLGPAAHSFTSKTRFYNPSSLEKYIEEVNTNGNGIKDFNILTLEQKMSEKMIMGLRLTNGVKFKDFYNQFNRELKNVYRKEIDELLEKKLIEVNENRVKLTEKGKLLGNKVFMEFI